MTKFQFQNERQILLGSGHWDLGIDWDLATWILGFFTIDGRSNVPRTFTGAATVENPTRSR
jgi:hypothetical protein